VGGGGVVVSPLSNPQAREPYPVGHLQPVSSVYTQLPSIFGGHLFHPQPEDAPCRVDGTHLTWTISAGNSINSEKLFQLTSF
jgi:hypothetical protein